jgi:alpha-galactosidase
MPFYHLANASDPVNDRQVRRRIKFEKAIRGPRFAVGDCYQVPADEWKGDSVQESFETAVGVGGQLTTFYKDLDPRQRALWKRWFHAYRSLGLAGGEYLNLYDVAFDEPEGHVVRKGEDLYYGFYAEAWPRSRKIELRGLDRARRYQVVDYASNEVIVEVSGAEPFLQRGFKGSLLLRARPLPAESRLLARPARR